MTGRRPDGCPRELEVLRAVRAGTWADAEDVRLHAASCDVCREVAAVARMFHEAHLAAADDLLQREMPLPSAGQIWWRSAVRARVEARRAAARPLVWVHALAGALAVGLGAGAIGLLWPFAAPVAGRLGDLAARVPPRAAETLLTAAQGHLLLLAIAVVCLFAAPLAVYFVLADD